MRLQILILSAFLLTALVVVEPTSAAPPGEPTSGSLAIVGGGFCPLRHTDVKAGISGFVARVIVTQSFENLTPRAIEAVYTFPLPHDAAVDDMTIRIGRRTIRGVIKTREEAAKIYQQAIQNGQTAALLNQERPNIFTQTVGNIPPGANIDVVISYTEMLTYEDGRYEFTFPMVVGPRYIPGTTAIGQTGGGFSPDTNRVPDGSKITPPIATTRAGHDISLAVALDAGLAIKGVNSPTHQIDIQNTGVSSAIVKLEDEATIPNKDFILRYRVAGSDIAEGLLTHTRGTSDGYFSLIIQPPARFPESDVTPKEIVFVLDSSGSMNGFPEAKAKQFIDSALGGLYPGDTFNVIKFSGDTAVLFPEPVYPSAVNVAKAREFVDSQWGGGGTEMMKAIKAALVPSDSQDHLRIVVFLTDGYVGNDFEILSEIKKHPNARVFAYGIGSSVNRFLITGMGQAGRGESEVISEQVNPEEADAAAHRLYEHLRSPLLTDVKLDFGSLPVTDIYPAQVPDLFAGKPIIVTGRFTGPAKGEVRLIAKRAGDAYAREIPVSFPTSSANNSVLPNLWARYKIEDLTSRDWLGVQRQQMAPALQQQITLLGLKYGLMTQFTSFVAVEEKVSNVDGKPQTIQVPVELPQGVQMEQGWANQNMALATKQMSPSAGYTSWASVASGGVINGAVGGPVVATASPRIAAPPPPPPLGSGGGVGSGSGGGIGGGLYRTGGGGGGVRTELKSKQPQIPAKDMLLASKISPQLLTDYQCWQKLADKSATAPCHIRDGKIAIEIITSGPIPASELGALGFEPASGQPVHNHLRGRITVEKLTQLAALKNVQFITLAK